VHAGRLGCPVCIEPTAVIDGAAGDDAVTCKCERCGLPFILPAISSVVERVAAMYGRPDPRTPDEAVVS
jgi:hypothetical protein